MNSYRLFEEHIVRSGRSCGLCTVGAMADADHEWMTFDLILNAFAEAGTVNSHGDRLNKQYCEVRIRWCLLSATMGWEWGQARESIYILLRRLSCSVSSLPKVDPRRE